MQVVVQALPLYVCCGAGSAPFSVIRRITPTCSSAVATELTKKLLNVRWNTPLGATGVADAGAGVGAGARAGPGRGAGGAGGPSPLVAVQPPTKLYFRQTRRPQSL